MLDNKMILGTAKIRKGALAAGVVLAVTMASSGAMALDTLNFTNCSSNNAGNVATGIAQLTVDVSDPGSNQVRFDFNNAGPADSSITSVYFDDGTILGIAQLIDSDDGVGGDPGVDYSLGGSPPNLPAANNCPGTPFQATAEFTVDPDPPTQPNGVNPGEFLGVVFDLQAGKSFADVIADLQTGALRVGFHVQGFANGGSESFVNDPLDVTSVPEPAAFAILGFGLVGLGYVRRRKFALAKHDERKCA